MNVHFYALNEKFQRLVFFMISSCNHFPRTNLIKSDRRFWLQHCLITRELFNMMTTRGSLGTPRNLSLLRTMQTEVHQKSNWTAIRQEEKQSKAGVRNSVMEKLKRQAMRSKDHSKGWHKVGQYSFQRASFVQQK